MIRMKKYVFSVTLLLLFSTREGFADTVLEFAQNNSPALNSIWQEEISTLQPSSYRIYSLAMDLDSLGRKYYLSMLYHPDLCGAYSCPFKVSSDGGDLLHILAPFIETSRYTLTNEQRAFMPDINIDSIIFSYDYKNEKYYRAKNNNFIPDNSFLLQHEMAAECEKCSSKKIPTDPVLSEDFEFFMEEIKYELGGELEISQLMLKALQGHHEVKNKTDIFKEYIRYLDNKLKQQGILNKTLCIEMSDIYGRNAQVNYWGILKKTYFMGLRNHDLYDISNGNSVKYSIDGTSVSNFCLRKIKTGTLPEDAVYKMPENCLYGGCIE